MVSARSPHVPCKKCPTWNDAVSWFTIRIGYAPKAPWWEQGLGVSSGDVEEFLRNRPPIASSPWIQFPDQDQASEDSEESEFEDEEDGAEGGTGAPPGRDRAGRGGAAGGDAAERAAREEYHNSHGSPVGGGVGKLLAGTNSGVPQAGLTAMSTNESNN